LWYNELMANGTLRPPVKRGSVYIYSAIAEEINQQMEHIVYAVGNKAGVCVFVKKGDVYRCKINLEAVIHGNFAFVDYFLDPGNRMVHIK